jgi:hypothetical protein
MGKMRPIHRLARVFLSCAAAVLLCSCVGIDSRITIRENGSGTLVLLYRISQLVVDLGRPQGEKGPVPLPVSREDFEKSLQDAKGEVRLTSYRRSEDEKDITIRAELAFNSVEALSKVGAFADADLSLASAGGKRTFAQVVSRAPGEPVTEDSLRMIDALFDGYAITWTVVTPRPILSASVGTLSADKRTLTYSTSVKEIMRSKTDIDLAVSW